MTWLSEQNICMADDQVYFQILSFSLLWLITGFVTRLTRFVPVVEQEFLIILDHMNSLDGLVRYLIINYMCSIHLVAMEFLNITNVGTTAGRVKSRHR